MALSEGRGEKEARKKFKTQCLWDFYLMGNWVTNPLAMLLSFQWIQCASVSGEEPLSDMVSKTSDQIYVIIFYPLNEHFFLEGSNNQMPD